ncbi:anthranilate synthase component I family protein [Chitinophaga nivalis]|uniref:Anthranilate synthase component 1 n=1 Tax=Chitinophaga nivalis TaxID=2991709 RepID=A0ABT3IFJ6_9BACT|nr:anthranilate synthase component I family protein [Chitinophaga nivalis]MCW3467577.1 anthranilate synthase component I family protein [Chitinophaga nivalis]MCW3482731.1 anthranilate synthase component I family protein [Chitinophaga nivalis]
MRTIQVKTRSKQMLADIYTPVGIYLRLRDKFPGAILLESTDYRASENSYSFICVKPIAGIEVTSTTNFEFKYPNLPVEKKELKNKQTVIEEIGKFLGNFSFSEKQPVPLAQSLFGYSTFDSVQFFEKITFNKQKQGDNNIPFMRYRFYQYVIAINHFKDELYLCENQVEGVDSEFELVESLIRHKDSPGYPFAVVGEESSNMTDEAYMEMVEKGKQHCFRGDVFQVVLSRAFQQSFSGDEFNVYRALRSINPSPYLFFFDYGDYKLMGSSPEAQLVIRDGKATIHPIAGTFRRTGDDTQDKILADQLLEDPKENAEHVMLVDLARNDLSRNAKEVEVSSYRQVQYYSHVIHLVSEVIGKVDPALNPFDLLAATFPAGTLSGAPKYRAMEIIDQYEPTARGFYGGCIGAVGFNGNFNHAIMIRSILSKMNTLYYQAGAGVVAKSVAASERDEVNNKLNALKQAILLAQNI